MWKDDSHTDIRFKYPLWILAFFLSYISGLTIWGGTILVQRNSWQGTLQNTLWVCCWDSQTEGPGGGQEDALCELSSILYDGKWHVISCWIDRFSSSFALETPEDSRHSNWSRHYCGKRKKSAFFLQYKLYVVYFFLTIVFFISTGCRWQDSGEASGQKRCLQNAVKVCVIYIVYELIFQIQNGPDLVFTVSLLYCSLPAWVVKSTVSSLV